MVVLKKDIFYKVLPFAALVLFWGFVFYSFLYATEVELLIVDKTGKIIQNIPGMVVEFNSLDENHIATIQGSFTRISTSLKSGRYKVFVFLENPMELKTKKLTTCFFRAKFF